MQEDDIEEERKGIIMNLGVAKRKREIRQADTQRLVLSLSDRQQKLQASSSST